ncbi:hypothetical protein SteCoe_2414 [Stentor coeruleus]|uniref:Uncharacterized protein n=1 Tax=Stentor coeruleus TaxID=5963 RepID=A0A1R2CZG1_9CILI|nr:hypothetical protein SteCoe_2414 [Stentor coeruleus]
MSAGDVMESMMQMILLLQEKEFEQALRIADEILAKDPKNEKVLQIKALLPRSIDKKKKDIELEQKEIEEEEKKRREMGEEEEEEEDEEDSSQEDEIGEYRYEDHPSSEEVDDEESSSSEVEGQEKKKL